MGMEDVLRIDKILDFCDVPQLFVARDAFDTLYLCLLYDDETVYRYTGIRISTRRLESFLAGKADLRLLYLQPENEHEYYDVVFQSGEYQKTLLKESVLLEDKLPYHLDCTLFSLSFLLGIMADCRFGDCIYIRRHLGCR